MKLKDKHKSPVGMSLRVCTEPVFVNEYGAHEWIPRNRFLGCLKGLQILAVSVPHCYMAFYGGTKVDILLSLFMYCKFINLVLG
jgi:hypothetical protein